MEQGKGKDMQLYLRGIGKMKQGGTRPVIACLVIPEDKWDIFTDEAAMNFLTFAKRSCIEKENLIDVSLEYCSSTQYAEFARLLG